MKIGVDGRTFALPEIGGTARSGIQLTNRLDKLVDDLTVYGHRNASSRLEVDSLQSDAYISNSKIYGLIWEQMALPITARLDDIDVLYSPEAYCPLFDSGFEKVITIHDVSSFLGYSPRWFTELQQFFIPRAVRSADAVITVSNFSKKEICEHIDVAEKKVHVVPNGVSSVFTADSVAPSPIELPEKYLLFVGSLSTRKNIHRLLEAFSSLKKNTDFEHNLVLIGPTDDPTVDSASGGISEYDSIVDHVHTPGYVTDRELKYAYENADLFVFPSVHEGFGIPPLEAMACGTPVVSSDAAAIPEVLGRAAHYFDPYDPEDISNKVAMVLMDDTLKERLRQLGSVRANSFTWQQSAEKLRGVLETVSQ